MRADLREWLEKRKGLLGFRCGETLADIAKCDDAYALTVIAEMVGNSALPETEREALRGAVVAKFRACVGKMESDSAISILLGTRCADKTLSAILVERFARFIKGYGERELASVAAFVENHHGNVCGCADGKHCLFGPLERACAARIAKLDAAEKKKGKKK